MKIQVVILLTIVTAIAADESAKIYCGRQLARTLAGLCYDSYSNQAKRSDNYEFSDYDSQYILPWQTAYSAQRLNGGRRKKSFGIVSECCDKPCTVEEMLTYC
uniref:Insulin-like peptide 4 n=1 Tax=Grapholita molesta TaxID=192188 RepID=A0A7D7PIW4_GRAMO|nr:insulin-like peptide 4 [Grapholita molesta]